MPSTPRNGSSSTSVPARRGRHPRRRRAIPACAPRSPCLIPRRSLSQRRPAARDGDAEVADADAVDLDRERLPVPRAANLDRPDQRVTGVELLVARLELLVRARRASPRRDRRRRSCRRCRSSGSAAGRARSDRAACAARAGSRGSRARQADPRVARCEQHAKPAALRRLRRTPAARRPASRPRSSSRATLGRHVAGLHPALLVPDADRVRIVLVVRLGHEREPPPGSERSSCRASSRYDTPATLITRMRGSSPRTTARSPRHAAETRPTALEPDPQALAVALSTCPWTLARPARPGTVPGHGAGAVSDGRSGHDFVMKV